MSLEKCKEADEFESMMASPPKINPDTSRYPYCIVWTPIPVLTWLFPFIGHMGICTSSGVIRDFAASHYVSEDNMAFGKPTKYWQLNPDKTTCSWDTAVWSAAEIYKSRTHNLCCDNCHSMVALALNNMKYNNNTNWNMVKLATYMIPYSKYVSFSGFIQTNLPFLILLVIVLLITFHKEWRVLF